MPRATPEPGRRRRWRLAAPARSSRAATRHGWEWPDFLEYSIGPHREVLDAVVDHDADRAGAAMDRLVTQSMVSLDYPAGPENAPSRPLTRA